MTERPRVLVTGAGGAIGRRVRARLDRDGVDASYLVSPRSGAPSGDTRVDVADITDGGRLDEVVVARRPTAIIHLASIVGADCDADPERTTAVNVEAVRSLTSIAREHGVSRVVLASTSAVYGDQYESPIDEEGELVLASRYAQSKRQAELVVAEAAGGVGSFSGVALRIFNVYGPGMVSSLANRLVAAPPESPVQLAGLDTFVRDYVHVDDVAAALIAAVDAELPRPWSLVNVASGVATSNRRLVAALDPVNYTVGAPRASYSCANVDAAGRLLGFSPREVLTRDSAR